MINEDPIVYKPGAYKSPGIYNGAGGVYNGHGVYNMGGDSLGIVYHTKFDNFDKDTGLDIPIVGPSLNWTVTNKDKINYNDVVVEGETKRLIKIQNTTNTPGNSGTLRLNNLHEIFDSEVLTIEATIYKEVYNGYWGFCSFFPAYNCFSYDRGFSFYESSSSNVKQLFNGTRDLFGQGWYGADFYERQNMNKPFTGGWTIDRTNGRRKVYTQNKKMAILSSMIDNIQLSCTNSYFYIVELKIYNIDKFNDME